MTHIVPREQKVAKLTPIYKSGNSIRQINLDLFVF